MEKDRSQRSLVEEAIAGAVSGLAATVPMTISMLVMQRMLPRRDQSTLEPQRVSDDMLRRSHADNHMSAKQERQFSVVAHLGYGAASGMAYALAERLLPLPRGIRGPVYGLFVWAASYAGWLPVVGTLPPPQRRPVNRNLLMIVAHFVWGLALDIAASVLLGRQYAGSARR